MHKITEVYILRKELDQVRNHKEEDKHREAHSEDRLGSVHELVVNDSTNCVKLLDVVAILHGDSINDVVHIIFRKLGNFWMFWSNSSENQFFRVFEFVS